MRSGQQTTPLNGKKSPPKHNCMFGGGGVLEQGWGQKSHGIPRSCKYRNWVLFTTFHSCS